MHRSRKNEGWERFEFGELKVSSLAVGDSPTCGQYFIHAVCGWRIVGPQGIVTGAFDYSTEEGKEKWPKFSESGTSLRNQRVAEFFQHLQQADLVVEKITADNVGSVYFSLTGGYSLDLLPIDSLPDVQWRFMARQGGALDFVLTGEGIEQTDD